MTPAPDLPPDSWDASSPAEQAARQEAYQRLAAAARRVGVPVERLRTLLERVARNEEETRAFLAGEVYGVPDEFLDDLVRLRLRELESDDGEAESGSPGESP
jgi:hypothetical protein